MMNQQWIRIWCAVWIAAWLGQASAEPVDPRNPVEWHRMRVEENRNPARWLPKRIRQLEAERTHLLATISTLPQFDPSLVPDRLGYHSGYADQDEGAAEHTVTVHFRYRPRLGGIALVPAANPRDRHGDSYAFPSRFKIDVLASTGPQDDETFDWIKVVDWMEEDFPHPGRYPVFFNMDHHKVAKVRMTVPRITEDSASVFYALGELFLFQGVDGRVADNMSVWGRTSIEDFEISDSFSLPPFWDAEYLYDGLTGLGVPLSEERVATDDLIIRFEPGMDEREPVQILLDLGRTQRVGRVEFWPTEAPDGIAAPLYAFPGKIRVELSNDPDFTTVKTVEVGAARSRMYHDNLLRVMCDAYEARYIRLTLDDLHEENGREVLGLGEISVSEHGKVFSEGCAVSAVGIPEEDRAQLPRLVDGNCRGHRIVSETDWIRGLAQRRPLDRRLAVVNRELAAARNTWRTLQLRWSILGGALLCLILFVAMVLQRLQRRRVLKGLKTRITRDLHDEVGSSLGGLSLTSEGLMASAENESTKETLRELSLMAREACASLRDVVWVTDQNVIRLPALIEKLVERAQQILSGIEVIDEVDPNIPDIQVSLSCKRHVTMFFREAVHNCARHAEATKVHFFAGIVDGSVLKISVSDNGHGFDLSGFGRGWGLDSMKNRAAELRGELDICSAPGEGTQIQLTVPLDALPLEPIHSYKTSN